MTQGAIELSLLSFLDKIAQEIYLLLLRTFIHDSLSCPICKHHIIELNFEEIKKVGKTMHSLDSLTQSEKSAQKHFT